MRTTLEGSETLIVYWGVTDVAGRTQEVFHPRSVLVESQCEPILLVPRLL